MRPLLLANTDIVLGGGEVGLVMLAEGLREHGHRPLVALPGRRRGELADRLERADLPFLLLGADEQRSCERLRSAAATSDLVHLWSGGALTLVDRCGVDVPIVYHVLVPNPTPFDAGHAQRAARVVCNSWATAGRFPGHPVDVVYNGVATPATPPATLGFDPERRTIAIIGGTSPRKGQLDALPALLDVVARAEDVDVALIGRVGGPVAMRLRRTARASDGRIRLVGYVPEVADHFAELALVIVPSRSEGFGRVAVEALRAGVPVLARRVEGLREALAEVRDPWLPTEPDGWADRILQELESPTSTPSELRQAARRFDPDRFVREIAAIHDQVAIDAGDPT